MSDIIDGMYLYTNERFNRKVRSALGLGPDERLYDGVAVAGEDMHGIDVRGGLFVTDLRVVFVKNAMFGKPYVEDRGDMPWDRIEKFGLRDHPPTLVIVAKTSLWQFDLDAVQMEGKHDLDQYARLSKDRMALFSESMTEAREAYAQTHGLAEHIERATRVDQMRQQLRQQRGF